MMRVSATKLHYFLQNSDFLADKRDNNIDTIAKRPISLRLREYLLCELKQMAKESHRSLNNLI